MRSTPDNAKLKKIATEFGSVLFKSPVGETPDKEGCASVIMTILNNLEAIIDNDIHDGTKETLNTRRAARSFMLTQDITITHLQNLLNFTEEKCKTSDDALYKLIQCELSNE
jgi:hypothetical protein